MEIILLLLLLVPLSGAVINALLGRYLPRRGVETIACLGVLGALVLSAVALVQAGRTIYDLTFCPWIILGDFRVFLNVHYDPLAALMALMVTFVSSIIHLYSVSFMREDRDYVRYFSYLNLFVFAMLVITLADNLVFVYLGWEWVGFCSYGLIGFWYTDPVNANAGRKAFIYTRIGDIAFGISLALFYVVFQDFSISYISSHASLLSATLATTLSLLLLWAALGKSAQLPLSVWLPDAMAGPTPVSALIHAATMVTAGVYLLMRLFSILLLSPLALEVIAALGAVTAIYAALAAWAQSDLKRVLAYSTMSQVGYMFLAVGAGDLIGGMFHLVSHAFFKALLFLAAGCVIQAVGEEHNIFRMGNLKRYLPTVFWLFVIGVFCLNAFPLIGGFFSKDRILLATYLHPGVSYKLYWLLGAIGAIITPLYAVRVTVMAFQDRPEGRKPEEIQPIPRVMVWILWPLALAALSDGLLNLPGGVGKNFLGSYLSGVPGARPDLGAPASLEWVMGVGSATLVVLTMALAYYYYRRRPYREPAREGLHDLLFSGFYLDNFYQLIFVRTYQTLATWLWRRVDEQCLDQGYEKSAQGIFSMYRHLTRFIWQEVDERLFDQGFVNFAWSFHILSNGLGYWSTGKLSTYLKMLLLGLTIFLFVLTVSWYLW
jgi:NADH-quinone oxidoreductase subunit L